MTYSHDSLKCLINTDCTNNTFISDPCRLKKSLAFTSLRTLRKELSIKQTPKPNLIAVLQRYVNVQPFSDGTIVLKPYAGVNIPLPFKNNLSYLTQCCLLSHFNSLKDSHGSFSYPWFLNSLKLRTPLFYKFKEPEDLLTIISDCLQDFISSPQGFSSQTSSYLYLFKLFLNTEKSLSYSIIHNSLTSLNSLTFNNLNIFKISPHYLIKLTTKEGTSFSSDLLPHYVHSSLVNEVQEVERSIKSSVKLFNPDKYNSVINTAMLSFLTNKNSEISKELRSRSVIKISVRKKIDCSFDKAALSHYIDLHDIYNYRTELHSLYFQHLYERFVKNTLTFHIKAAKTNEEKKFYKSKTDISPIEKAVYNHIISYLYMK